MKNKLLALLLNCIFILSCPLAHAGLIGEIVDFYISFDSGGTGTAITELRKTIEAPSTSYLGMTVDDTTIKIALGDNTIIPATVKRVIYGINVEEGSFPELDWATFAATYPKFDLSKDLLEFKEGFRLIVNNRFDYPSDFILSISTLGDGPVAVSEPQMIGILAIGLLAFVLSRRRKGPNIHSRLPA